jgi:MYXO-CTERM domain-containing protein
MALMNVVGLLTRARLGAPLCWLVGVLVATLGTGCGRSPSPVVEDDQVPSLTVGVEGIVDGWRRHGAFFVSPVLAAPRAATRVGALVRSTPGARVRLEAAVADDVADVLDLDDDDFVPMQEAWRDPVFDDVAVVRADLPVRATAVVVRVRADDVAALRGLTFEAVVPLPARPSGAFAPPVVQRGALLDGYEPRSAWGARAAGNCDSNAGKTKVTVHHTVSRLNQGATRAQFAAEVRATQAFHMESRGYCDIAYHFVVSADGTVWEGRSASLLGAHTGSHNTNNLGVAFLGCFHPTSACDGLGSTTPPTAMIEGAGAFLGRVASHYGIDLVVGSTLLGHRDNPDQSTACPGDVLRSKLETLRSLAVGDGPPDPTPTTGTVQGAVWDLSVTADVSQATALGARLPGATVAARRDGVVVATATARENDAYWSLELPPGNYRLTASFAGFSSSDRDVALAAGADDWASIGLLPLATSAQVTVAVVDDQTGAPLTVASVQFGSDPPLTVDGVGQASASVPLGALVVVARAEGYEPREETHQITGPTTLTVRLAATVADDPGDEPVDDPSDDPVDPPAGETLDRITIRNAPSADGGGCGCRSTSEADAVACLWLVGLLGVRRRRRRRRGSSSPRSMKGI